MSTEATSTVTKMALLTVGGWTISMQEMIDVAKLVSFVVPTALSIVVYIRDTRKKRNDEKELD